jgi:tetratricopeptide (TPR) repeat protein
VTTKSPATGVTLDPDARILRWTEAARRNRSQRPWLARRGELERAGQLLRSRQSCQQALELDPENLAANHQQIYFELGRLSYRLGLTERAREEFRRALVLRSLAPMSTDFYHAWARVYLARLERRRGHLRASRAEAEAGLALNSPALELRVAWPEQPRRSSTALEELHALAR